jgi:hypothetical protein
MRCISPPSAGTPLACRVEHDALRAGDAPTQEIGDRADAFVALGQRLAALGGGPGRAHGGERAPVRRQNRANRLDQRESG